MMPIYVCTALYYRSSWYYVVQHCTSSTPAARVLKRRSPWVCHGACAHRDDGVWAPGATEARAAAHWVFSDAGLMGVHSSCIECTYIQCTLPGLQCLGYTEQCLGITRC
jgi:hypothetical protein